MKRFLVVLSVLFIGLFTLVSCEENTVDYYIYSVEFHITNHSDVQAIDDELEPRINQLYEFTESEAQAEWDSFINSVDESKIVLYEGDYYIVGLEKQAIDGNRFVTESIFAQKIWGNK